MNDILLTFEKSFTNTIDRAGYEFLNDIAIYSESCICEGSSSVSDDTIITKINKFISTIIAGFISFKNNIQNEIERRINNKRGKSISKNEYNKLVKLKESGIKEVETIDYHKLAKTYVSACSDMFKYGKKFSNISYKYIEDLNKDISVFNELLDNYNTKLDKIYDKKIKCGIDKMIKFYEDEMTGRGQVFNTINDSISCINNIKNECDKIVVKKEIVGPGILPKHISFIRKIILGLTNFVKKWISKIIVGTVVIFA